MVERVGKFLQQMVVGEVTGGQCLIPPPEEDRQTALTLLLLELAVQWRFKYLFYILLRIRRPENLQDGQEDAKKEIEKGAENDPR